MPFTPVSIDPNNIDAAPGPYQHWILNWTGTTRYVFAYNIGSSLLSLYRSTDSGATWAAIDVGNFPGSLNDNSLLQSELIVGGGSAGSDLIRTMTALNRTTGGGTTPISVLEFCEFDVGTLAWSGPTNIGGGFDQHNYKSLDATECASLQRFLRGDGTEIVVYQCDPLTGFANGVRRIRILKRSGATWTQLAQFGAETFVGPTPGADYIQEHYVLWSGVKSGADVVYIFANHAHVPVPDGGSFYEDPLGMELGCITVSATDGVSAFQSIEQDVEQMPAVTNPAQPTASTENGRAAINLDSSEVAFGYGYQTNTFPAGAGAEVHVVRGDLTGDPLAPSWTVDVITTNQPKWNGGTANDVSVTYDNPAKIAFEYFGAGVVTVAYGEHALANLKVYWATQGASNKGKLKFSQFDGISTWTPAVQLWPDPDSSAVSLDGFDVGSEAPTPSLPLSLSCPPVSTATVGVFYDEFLQVIGGVPPLFFEIIP